VFKVDIERENFDEEIELKEYIFICKVGSYFWTTRMYGENIRLLIYKKERDSAKKKKKFTAQRERERERDYGLVWLYLG